MYSKEAVGTFAGVAIPSWLRFFDCRLSDEEPTPRAPWGESLFSCERAEVDLGLKRGWGESDATTPRGGSAAHIDNRDRSRMSLASLVQEMIKTAEDVRAEYEVAKRRASPDGCGVYFKPVAVALSNFGWSVIADKCERAVANGVTG